MIRRGAAVLLGAIVALGLLAGCTVTGTVYATEEHRETLDVGLAPTVIVDTFNGRITVTAGGENTVTVRASSRGSGASQAEAERDLAQVEVRVAQVGDRVTITARRRDNPASLGDSGADMEVAVPPPSSLELRTSNGRIESANVTGRILARASNGAITTRGGNGLDLDTSNGPMSVSSPTGKLRLRTSNGALDIIAASDVHVTAETSNAPLTFNGSLAPGSHTFDTSNGSLALTLPGDSAFTIDGATTSGSVRTDFPRLEVSGSSIRGTAGISSVTVIQAKTSNGDLTVMTQRP